MLLLCGWMDGWKEELERTGPGSGEVLGLRGARRYPSLAPGRKVHIKAVSPDDVVARAAAASLCGGLVPPPGCNGEGGYVVLELL